MLQICIKKKLNIKEAEFYESKKDIRKRKGRGEREVLVESGLTKKLSQLFSTEEQGFSNVVV